MKKYITYIMVFFAAVIAIDQLVGLAGDYMRHHSKPSLTQQFNDLCLKDRHDVLILGSSRAKHHYIPQIFEDSLGLDVYNAGFDGNGIIFSYGILQMIIERYSPKIIIYDVEPDFDILEYKPDDNCKRYISNLKQYYTCTGIPKIMKDISLPTYIMSFSGIYRYNSSLLSLFKEFLYGGITYDKGFLPLNGVMQSDTLRNNRNNEIDRIKVKYLHQFIKCCKSNDIKLVLAISPKYEFRNDVIESIANELAIQYDVVLLNHYQDRDYLDNNVLFNDYAHLNDKGASIYSKNIVREIQKKVALH